MNISRDFTEKRGLTNALLGSNNQVIMEEDEDEENQETNENEGLDPDDSELKDGNVSAAVGSLIRDG